MKVKTHLKAGGLTTNHNEALVRDLPKTQGPKVKAHHKAGSGMNHNSGHELCDLLAPITPATFVAEYWGRRSLYIKGHPDKVQQLFQGMFDRAAFDRAVHAAAVKKVKGFALYAGTYQSLYSSSKERLQPFPLIQADQMEARLAEGASVSAWNISDQRIATFAAALKTQLHYPGDILVYATLSPEGSGLPAHIDGSSSIFIQCEGRKRYVISEGPILEWPLGSAILSVDGTAEYFDHDIDPWEEIQGVDLGSFTEVVMEPGDVLFVPAGTVHATQALSQYSLGLNLHLERGNFLNLISRVLERTLLSNPAWRHMPAVSAENAKPGELPAEVEQFFAARLEELRHALNSLGPGALELNRAWHKLVADPGVATIASIAPSPNEPSGKPIHRKDILCLSKKAPMTYAVGTDMEGETSLSLFYADKEVSVVGEWVPFLEALVHQEQFMAESATKWAPNGQRYPWKTVQEYLQVLRDQGILEHAGA